jgi:hypothetical protein
VRRDCPETKTTGQYTRNSKGRSVTKKKVLTFDSWDSAYDLDQESDNRRSLTANLNHELDNKFKNGNSSAVVI